MHPAVDNGRGEFIEYCRVPHPVLNLRCSSISLLLLRMSTGIVAVLEFS
jgi:hypothetical protein